MDFKSLMGRRQFMITAGLASGSMLTMKKLATSVGQAQAQPGGGMMQGGSGSGGTLMTFKRGVYTPEEKAALDAWKKMEYQATGGSGGGGGGMMPGGQSAQAVETGPTAVDVQLDGVDDVSAFEMSYYAKGWDKYNPLWLDSNYAKKTWYGQCPAIPTIREPMAMAMLPSELGDEARPSGDPLVGDGYDFELYYYKPIFAGDSFTSKAVAQDCVDLTVDGSTTRYFIAIVEAEMYNQKNEMVCRAKMYWPTFLQKYEEGETSSKQEMAQGPMAGGGQQGPGEGGGQQGPGEGGGQQGQTAGGGMQARYTRAAHEYTDADWEYLKNIWKNEKIRGAEILYWEDVKVGDEPPMTAENPVTDYDARRYTGFHHTVGAIGGDSARDYLMTGNSERRFYKRDDGVYDVSNSDRTHFLNFVGRNFCLRTITNWCGDDGFVRKVGWRMVNDFRPEEQMNHFPEGHFRESWLLKVPELKKAGKFINTHGMGPDCAICKAYVTEKFIDPDTKEHMVMLTAWAEDMDGNIFQECEFSVALPTRA
jgi:hypothetical protein